MPWACHREQHRGRPYRQNARLYTQHCRKRGVSRASLCGPGTRTDRLGPASSFQGLIFCLVHHLHTTSHHRSSAHLISYTHTECAALCKNVHNYSTTERDKRVGRVKRSHGHSGCTVRIRSRLCRCRSTCSRCLMLAQLNPLRCRSGSPRSTSMSENRNDQQTSSLHTRRHLNDKVFFLVRMLYDRPGRMQHVDPRPWSPHRSHDSTLLPCDFSHF
jgi:hypothetical protein